MLTYQLIKEKYEKIILIFMFLVAIIRIFAFSGAFPFFNNVDEHMHFDLVVKYARGYLPNKEFPYYFDKESVKYIARYETPEYINKITLPPGFRKTSEMEASTTDDFLYHKSNHELYSPPFYYMIAGLWYDIGKFIGLQDGYLLYWIRFLNLPIYCIMIWISYLFCKLIYPDDINIRLGTVILLAFIPQDVFYSISNDVMSSLMALISLYLMLNIYISDKKLRVYCITGLMASTTVLVKLSNIPFIIVFGILFINLIHKYVKQNKIIQYRSHLIMLATSLLTPIAIWCSFNYFKLGDATGTRAHIEFCGWQLKPFNELWHHPIFTLQGIYYFISHLITSFWRGEFVWHSQIINTKSSDVLYLISSVIFCLFGMKSMLFEKNELISWKGLWNKLLVLTPLLFILFLGYLSIKYDFCNDFYPSRKLPYFVSGRLMLASMIPLLITYIKGIEYLTIKIKNIVDPLIIIILIVSYSLYTEITVTYKLGIFANPLNLFHL
jgi:hypothetical protein